MHFLLNEKTGEFCLEHADRCNEVYLPLTNEGGILNCITPDGHGDSKISQNEFLMVPVSSEDLKENMSSRNFWCQIEEYGAWSAMGTSARQQSARFTDEQEDMTLEVGMLWQKTTRVHQESGLKAEVLNFCPPTKEKAEIMRVKLTNTGTSSFTVRPIAAVPIYARSADNLRDHRHVTSLLNRIKTTADGVEVIPTLSFDERGHQINQRVYGVYGRESSGIYPEGFYPVLSDFTGEGGNLYWPQAVVSGNPLPVLENVELQGYEALGGICFSKTVLKPEETREYLFVISYDRAGLKYLQKEQADKAFEELALYWKEKTPIECHTKDIDFNVWMKWVSIQPFLRRMYGCSFLPHHDYGRGGRGWRDLWQDCLALILTNPTDIRQDLINFYSGVRMDGSNATIIGTQPGEFKADRNTIVRVWMDHGYWPVLTTKFYLDQTGDYEILLEQTKYFNDGLSARGTRRISDSLVYTGSIMEHMLVQNVTQFFDVGDHNHMKLRGADWNDALDMAKDKGESVAFTAAYSGNYQVLAEMLATMQKQGKTKIELSRELIKLLQTPKEIYDDVKQKQEKLDEYYKALDENSKNTEDSKDSKQEINIEELREDLKQMAQWIWRHIRTQEAVEGENQELWFNGYYDNHGKPVENQQQNRMMLTSQVFSIMSKTATDEQIEQIVKSVDHHLFDLQVGGYRLNTDFHEVKMDMGRAFGFAYGHKENGAVFSHMAVMYAYALYSCGFAVEGYKVIHSLQEQSMNFEKSGIYPGIPEYFNDKGKGMYHYLTGAASWLVLTVTTQMFGVRGEEGNLIFVPQLLREQFDKEGNAEIAVSFAGQNLRVIYKNVHRREIGDYEVEEIYVDGEKLDTDKNMIERSVLKKLDKEKEHVIAVVL